MQRGGCLARYSLKHYYDVIILDTIEILFRQIAEYFGLLNFLKTSWVIIAPKDVYSIREFEETIKERTEKCTKESTLYELISICMK